MSPLPTALNPSPSWTAEDRAAVDRLAKGVVRLGLGTVAVLFIESVRPLNFVGSQMMHFLAPVVHAFGTFSDYDRLSRILEDRHSIDLLVEALERAEQERVHANR